MADLRDLALPDLVTPDAFARVVGIPVHEASAYIRRAGGVEVGGVLVIPREDLLRAIRGQDGRVTAPPGARGASGTGGRA